MAQNYSRPLPSPTLNSDLPLFSQQRQQQPSHRDDNNPPHDKRRPPPLAHTSSRRAAAMSPTFHLDPDRSSSSDNGSLAHPFPFPPASYPLPQGPRDSVTTHHSSIYPQSTSSYSNTSPPSPASPSEGSFSASIQTDGGDSTSLDPHSLHHIDPDDVSYRLRLLVRNNYFLPPAHSKPSQSELAAASAEQAATQQHLGIAATKSTSFRDIFRVGKPKTPPSRPSATVGGAGANQAHLPPKHHIAPAPPTLRQTKSTNAVNQRPTHTRMPTSFSGSATSSRALSVAAHGGPVERRGRVVVIRETVEDLAIAAKEAEIQMRVHQQQQKHETQPEPSGGKPRRPKSTSSKKSAGPRVEFEDEEFVVDPTDAVDLPSYGFEVQASAFIGLGLGVDASGPSAAVLADQLPPPMSPDFGMSKEDMLWRKALLHQAVGLSMHSIPAPTPSTSANSTPNGSRIGKQGSASPFGVTSPPSSSIGHASASVSASKPKSPILPIVEDLEGAVGSRQPPLTRTRKKSHGASSKESSQASKQLSRHPMPDGAGRGRSASQPVGQQLQPKGAPSAAGTVAGASEIVRPFLARPSSRHRASPAPQRSETPGVPSQALQPPPRKTAGVRPGEPTIPQSPYSGDFEMDKERLSTDHVGASLAPMRSHSPLFPPPEQAGETIRKTLTRPLLSEGYETEVTTRSSEYFTPFSPSLIVQSPSGKELPKGRSSRDLYSSGSEYSLDQAGEGDDTLHDLRTATMGSQASSTRKPLPVFASPSSAEITHRTDSYEASLATRPSVDSPMAPRPSMAESHASLFSTSFAGPRSGSRPRTSEDIRPGSALRRHRLSDDMIQPPPLELLTTTGSNLGLHSLGGVGELQSGSTAFSGPIPRPSRASTTPENLAARRAQLLQPLDMQSVAALGPIEGVKSAPAIERDSSFLDFADLPPMPSLSLDDEAVVYIENKSRSRLSSNARTIVPSPKRAILGLPDEVEEPTIMRFDNSSSNPYLQNPYADVDRTRPLTNTPAAPQSSFLSSLSSLSFLNNKREGPSKESKKSSHPLAGYARHAGARSTPTLSPSHKAFADMTPRPSNVSDSRFNGADPLFQGMVNQHLQTERDLLKRLAKGAARRE